MSQLGAMIVFAGAFSQMVSTWNLWKRGALAPEIALGEIGRVLSETDKSIGDMAAELKTEEKALAATTGGKTPP